MKLDDEIDRLYQLPLKEFTPARNALMKQVRGADASRVRALQKPNAAAWGVNQLYWRDRPAYDRLIAAAEELRKAHRSVIAGKAADLHASEAAHRDAVRDAARAVRDILESSAESATAPTLASVNETLEALPATDEPPGRLTRPLKRMGFEALAGVGARPASAAAAKLSLVSSRDKKAAAEPAIPPARQREIDELEARLRTAQFAERQLQTDIERARREVERAERDHDRIEQELAEAAEKLKRLRGELTAKEKSQKASLTEQGRIEERLEKLRRRDQ